METTGTAELLRPSEAAAMLSVSVRTLWGWTRDGRVPAVYIGGAKRYARADILAFIAGLPRATASDFAARVRPERPAGAGKAKRKNKRAA